MTAARHQRKALAWPWTWAALLGLVLAGGVVGRGGAQAAPEERTVVNPNSGLGLSGFDPVAYFTDNKPVIGKPELEFSRSGAVWRFARKAGAFFLI